MAGAIPLTSSATEEPLKKVSSEVEKLMKLIDMSSGKTARSPKSIEEDRLRRMALSVQEDEKNEMLVDGIRQGGISNEQASVLNLDGDDKIELTSRDYVGRFRANDPNALRSVYLRESP